MRTVLVTGVTRGLGRALALDLAADGHLVLGCGRNREDLARLTLELAGHELRQVDVAVAAQVEAWAHDLRAAGHVPDMVLNNAGLINHNAPLWQVPAEEFSRVVDVNLKGIFHVIRAFLPAMIERGRGVIVNLSSGWGRSTAPEVAPYCATKWAVEGLTQALAQELPPGLATVALNPGVICTDMLKLTWGASAAAYPGPESWAERAAPFLLGLGADDNGASLTVPGG